MRARLKATIFRLHRRLHKNTRQRRRLKDQIRHRDAMIAKLQAQLGGKPTTKGILRPASGAPTFAYRSQQLAYSDAGFQF